MASLSANPLGADFEDLVGAHFASRGMYVETGVTERDPRDLLELDIVWTDYRDPAANRNAVEIKSGGWGLHDFFKFYGWLNYLRLPKGAFIYRQLAEQAGQDSMDRLSLRTGVTVLYLNSLDDIDLKLETKFNLPKSTFPYLTEVWRYSFWIQRLLLRSLSKSIDLGVCPETGRATKQFIKLINDATFFEPDVRMRVNMLLGAHMKHRYLGRSAALEIEGLPIDFEKPADTATFKNALFSGAHFPVQACLYVSHRGRLAVLKAAIDYLLAKRRGDLPRQVINVFGVEVDLGDTELHAAFLRAVSYLEKQKTPQQYAVFWQVFLWAWGGYILGDRRAEEYDSLSSQTGVPIDEIDTALAVFDIIFPLPSGWFKTPAYDCRSVLQLMPAALRGVGAFHRLNKYGKAQYAELGFKDYTARHMAQDNNTAVRLLDGGSEQLVR